MCAIYNRIVTGYSAHIRTAWLGFQLPGFHDCRLVEMVHCSMCFDIILYIDVVTIHCSVWLNALFIFHYCLWMWCERLWMYRVFITPSHSIKTIYGIPYIVTTMICIVQNSASMYCSTTIQCCALCIIVWCQQTLQIILQYIIIPPGGSICTWMIAITYRWHS